jgi:hypothetical protein
MNIINPQEHENLVGIDSEVMARLADLAEPFVDDPNSVLRRELGLDRPAQAVSNGAAASPALDRPTARRTRRGTSRRPRLTPRAPKGSLTPEEAFEQPILAALHDAGGALPFRHALEAVGRRMEGVLNEHDRVADERGVARWQKRVPFVRLKLVERGLLDGDAPRGIWQLTDAGREALAQTAAGASARETTE